MSDGSQARRFHALTRHGSPTDRSQLVSFQPLDPSNRPSPFKQYVDRAPVPLPIDLAETGVAATAVLSGRRPPSPSPLDARVLAALLFFTAGVTRTSSSPVFGDTTYFRTAMSAGNLHPVEVYVVSAGVDGIADGVHHFAPLEFGLTALDTAAPDDGPACHLVFTGIPWRTAWKYGERGYRHLYWDAGTMLANVLALVDAHGLSARVQVGFADDRVAALVGVDGVTEFPLVVVSVGERSVPELSPEVRPASLPAVAPISPEPLTFPLVHAVQDDGVLTDAAAVAAWRDRAVAGRRAPFEIEPPAGISDEPIEDVILRRGSTRMMRPDPVPPPALWWGMAAAERAVPADFVRPGATLLEHDLLVHGVEGLEPGAYRWRGPDLELLLEGDVRALGRRLTLDQPLGGDGAYTTFHCADLDVVLGALGSRGYRAAQLEAGIAAGRLSLAAFALGLGATGLTFYDEAVRQVFATRASCMLVTAVGVPEYRNRPGGRPGQLAELGGYDGLMQRLSLQLHRGRR